MQGALHPATRMARARPSASRVDNGGDEWQESPISATEWLDQNRPVDMMAWAPGHPELLRDCIMSNGGLIDRKGCSVFNLYRPPLVEPGDPAGAGPWIEHVQKVYGL